MTLLELQTVTGERVFQHVVHSPNPAPAAVKIVLEVLSTLDREGREQFASQFNPAYKEAQFLRAAYQAIDEQKNDQ